MSEPRRGGLVLAEVIVVLALSALALAILAASITSIMKHSASLSYNASMNAEAKKTTENFNTDVRSATDIASPSSTGFTLSVPDGAGGSDEVEYKYDAAKNTLARIFAPGTAKEASNTLLEGIDTFAFTYYTIDNYTTTKSLEIKKIHLSAKIVRGSGLENKVEQDIAARTLMRNKGASN